MTHPQGNHSSSMVNIRLNNGSMAISGNSASLDADAFLQASRRLDWRFLLPNPHLGHVASLSTVPDNLLDSLRLFSDSLTELTLASNQQSVESQYDVIVVRHLSKSKLKMAAERLKPGGYLYAEIDGIPSPKRQDSFWKNRQFVTPTRCVTAVTRAGFSEVQAHWHWPNFANCTKIIPLNDREALHYAFVGGGRSAKARLQSVAGRFLLGSGLLVHTVSRFSIVACLGDK